MAKVAIIGTGGTISSIGFGPLDLLDYAHSGQKMTVEQVLEKFPVVREAAELTLIPYKAVGSPEIGPSHWLELTRLVHEAVAADASLDRGNRLFPQPLPEMRPAGCGGRSAAARQRRKQRRRPQSL